MFTHIISKWEDSKRSARLKGTVFHHTLPSLCQIQLTRQAQIRGVILVWEGEGPYSTALGLAFQKTCTTECMAVYLILDLSAWSVSMCPFCCFLYLHIYLLVFLLFPWSVSFTSGWFSVYLSPCQEENPSHTGQQNPHSHPLWHWNYSLMCNNTA